MKEFLQKLFQRKEASSEVACSPQFLFFISLCAFFVSAEFGIIRSASTSLFISSYSASFFPYAWLATVPLNFFVIYLYNRYLPLLGCLKVFFSIVTGIIIVNTLTAFLGLKEIVFFQFVWKDVYILLMFKQLWSLIHTTIEGNRAKYLYGILFGIGAVGSVVGGWISSVLALRLGSQNLFLFTLPLYLSILFTYFLAFKESRISLDKIFRKQFTLVPKAMEAFSLIKKSSSLSFLLVIVIFLQVAIACLDFRFNLFLEKAIPDVDLRTQYCGWITMVINAASGGMQFFGSFILLHFLGLKKSHFLVPLFLFSNSLVFVFIPTFFMAAYSFIAIKAMDYSFFGVIREMLYRPMKTDEKFRAKAVIDVFAARTAKALASIMILFLQNFFMASSNYWISIFVIGIFLLWIGAVFFFYKEEPVLVYEELPKE